MAVKKDNIIREHICLMSAAPSNQDDLRYAAGVLANIIGDCSNSRLYWALVDSAVADVADMEYDPMDGTGAFYTYISCGPEDADRVIEIAKDCLAEVCREGVTKKELRASKNKMASVMTLNGELPMGRFVPLGGSWIYRKEYRSLSEELKLLQAVGQDDINNLLEQYPLENVTMLGLGPCEKIL